MRLWSRRVEFRSVAHGTVTIPLPEGRYGVRVGRYPFCVWDCGGESVHAAAAGLTQRVMALRMKNDYHPLEMP